MSDKIQMRALMTLPARKVKRGATFEANAQDARDLEQFGRAERVEKPADAPKGARK